MLKPKVNLDELPGFEQAKNEENNDEKSTQTKKKKSSQGGFQGMGFGFPVMKGITKRGYKQPTPIQRKTIPLALEGKDLVAMARTGSGKTACFVLPILDKLISPANKSLPGKNPKALILSPTRELALQTIPLALEGKDLVAMARTGSGKTACFVLPILDKLISPANKSLPGKNPKALILSPTRELALQTLRFVRELGKFTGLSSAAILGGESIDHQFSVMSGTPPDIVVATPGRFLHICVEMNLKLDNIKTVVFDEADRLFELGFGDQLREIVSRLPSSRQTLLFSATLPKMIVEFARAGLSDPVLIRLDVDWKLPSTLWLGWINVRAELKTAALLLLLDKVLTETSQAVVFAATKHHVEYLHLILQKAGITSTYAYSGLDASARKIALGRFSNKKCSVLIVTDVAARGLDLPALDTVINYNFPAKPKLFVHRVGRSARAGRAGRAFSFVTADDLAHLLDLQLFLGTELKIPSPVANGECPSGVWGTMPVSLLEIRHQDVVNWEKESVDIADAARVCGRGWMQYIKWREPASAEANKRAKVISHPVLAHPFLVDGVTQSSVDMVEQIKNYTPRGTILELSAKNDSPMYLAMKAKKLKHGNLVERARENKKTHGTLEGLSAIESSKNKKNKVIRDENYIPHTATDQHTELGMSVNFNASAASAELDLGVDSGEGARNKKNQLRWDRKRKKMVHVDQDGGRKMIRSESGGRIPASFRSGRYEEWKRKNIRDNESDDDDAPKGRKGKSASEFRPHWVKHNERVNLKKQSATSKEFKDKQQIVKERLRKEKVKMRLKRKTKTKKNRKK